MENVPPNYDGVTKSLKCFVALHPSSLQRTYCTSHSSGFGVSQARLPVPLVFVPFCIAIVVMTIYEIIN